MAGAEALLLLSPVGVGQLETWADDEPCRRFSSDLAILRLVSRILLGTGVVWMSSHSSTST